MNPVSERKTHPISEPEMPVLGRSVSECETDPSRRARCVRFLVDGSDGADNDDDDDEYGFGNTGDGDDGHDVARTITMATIMVIAMIALIILRISCDDDSC